jgi:hypothetical protein
MRSSSEQYLLIESIDKEVDGEGAGVEFLEPPAPHRANLQDRLGLARQD